MYIGVIAVLLSDHDGIELRSRRKMCPGSGMNKITLMLMDGRTEDRRWMTAAALTMRLLPRSLS